MDRNEAQAAGRNSAGNIRLRRILPDCVLFLIPLLLLPFFLRHSFSGGNPEEYRRIPVPVQHLIVSDAGAVFSPLPDCMSGTLRMPEHWLSDNRPRFYPGRPELPAVLNLEVQLLLLARTSICIEDRVLTNCRKFLKFSLHVRAGPAPVPVFRKFDQIPV